MLVFLGGGVFSKTWKMVRVAECECGRGRGLSVSIHTYTHTLIHTHIRTCRQCMYKYSYAYTYNICMYVCIFGYLIGPQMMESRPVPPAPEQASAGLRWLATLCHIFIYINMCVSVRVRRRSEQGKTPG